MKHDSSMNCKESISEIDIIHRLYGITPPTNPHTHYTVLEEMNDYKLPGNRFEIALGKANSYSLNKEPFNNNLLVV